MSYTGLGQQARRRRRGFGFRGQISMWVTDHRAPALCNTITAVSCKSAKGRTGTDGSSHTHLHTQQPAACWTCFSPCAVYPGHYSTYVYDRARVLPRGFMNTPSDCEIDPARDAAGAACLSRPHAKRPLTASRGEPKYGAAEQYPHSFVVEFDRSLGGQVLGFSLVLSLELVGVLPGKFRALVNTRRSRKTLTIWCRPRYTIIPPPRSFTDLLIFCNVPTSKPHCTGKPNRNSPHHHEIPRQRLCTEDNMKRAAVLLTNAVSRPAPAPPPSSRVNQVNN